MKSYAERTVFSAAHLEAWRRATVLVACLGDDWGDELRCHELSRAVAHVLVKEGASCVVRDGLIHAIEHSWILLRDASGLLEAYAILDVYAPGRLPQVQLVDDHFAVSRGYEPGPERSDVRAAIVRCLVEEMMCSGRPCAS